MKRETLLLYAITDRNCLNGKPLDTAVREALEGGATIIQLREKFMEGKALLKLALSIKAVCNEYDVPLIINDNVMLAKEIDADGVHVGHNDMSISEARKILGTRKIIGATARTLKQAKEAELAGADYLGSGAVFGTTTKSDAVPMPLNLFSDICRHVSIPVAAIGGICLENIDMLKGTHLAGACFVSGIFAADNITQTTKQLKEKLTAIVS